MTKYLTKEEASKLFCPKINSECISDKCMFWEYKEVKEPKKGYRGMITLETVGEDKSLGRCSFKG